MIVSNVKVAYLEIISQHYIKKQLGLAYLVFNQTVNCAQLKINVISVNRDFMQVLIHLNAYHAQLIIVKYALIHNALNVKMDSKNYNIKFIYLSYLDSNGNCVLCSSNTC